MAPLRGTRATAGAAATGAAGAEPPIASRYEPPPPLESMYLAGAAALGAPAWEPRPKLEPLLFGAGAATAAAAGAVVEARAGANGYAENVVGNVSGTAGEAEGADDDAGVAAAVA